MCRTDLRWLSKDNPDPDGHHLKIVAECMELYLSTELHKGRGTGDEEFADSPLNEAWRECGVSGELDCVVFWDYCVLYQGQRTAEQQALFSEGLRASNVWYGHYGVVVWLQTVMPSGWKGAGHADSGWCVLSNVAGTPAGPAQLLVRRAPLLCLRPLTVRALAPPFVGASSRVASLA